DAQAQVWSDFAQTLGPARGRHALKSLETLCQVITDHARRPVMRHEVTCACLGADEAIFAHFIAASGAGEREEAMMFAMLLVRADFAPLMLAEAEALALALKQIHQIETRHAARPRTLH
ncbi:MAG: hypothetical protein HRU31_19255, partial [Rhodobacteraceae bacterium]|nr:hypothetical protein [Paracoccaceae bacterium]